MSVRIDRINSASCPKSTEHCHYDQYHVDITVDKRTNANAQPWFVQTWGLQEGEELLIERVKKEKCDPMYAPMYCAGQAMCLSECFPAAVLTMPGTYRFRMSNNQPLNWDDDFAMEASPIHPEYAELWLMQQKCCQTQERK